MQAHQIISIVEGDFSDRGAARVRQVGVTVVDRESAETYEGVQRIVICQPLVTGATRAISLGIILYGAVINPDKKVKY